MVGPVVVESGVKRCDKIAVGNDVMRASDQMTRMIIFACILGILNLIGYMMAKYLSILIATIV